MLFMRRKHEGVATVAITKTDRNGRHTFTTVRHCAHTGISTNIVSIYPRWFLGEISGDTAATVLKASGDENNFVAYKHPSSSSNKGV